jgi:diguanylate cyclase (GGDEF)-like protein/PAS domain S-box-containing protein
MQLLYHQTPSMFFTVDTQYCISSANAFVTKKLGYDVNEIINIKMHHVYSIDDKDNIEHLLRRCFENPEQLHEWEIRQRRRDNSIVWVKQSAQVVTTTDVGMQILLASEDITQKHEHSLELSYQATHDALTGLVNRLEFERAIKKLIKRTTDQAESEHVMCYIDLDHFNVVNDACGHSAGDELLKSIASILSNKVRRNDLVCRMGGDEFTILMENCSPQKGAEIAEKLRLVINNYDFNWQGNQFKVGASIGIFNFGSNKQTYSNIISCADEACYSAKSAGRNCVRVYDASPHVLTANEKRTQSLKQAMLEERFELYAQPVFKVDDISTVFGYELLLRMHYESELIPASQFLKHAQRFDYLISIDRWVINQAFDWMNENRHKLGSARCTINLSTDSVSNTEFLEFVVQKLRQYRIDGDTLCFEIAELSVTENLKDVVNFMTELTQYNASFILDNFGGDSSLFGHIKLLPIDVVKIDGALTCCLVDHAINVATVRAINDIAHVVEKTTIATTVEDEATLTCLIDIGVDYVQGDLLGKPKSIRLIL